MKHALWMVALGPVVWPCCPGWLPVEKGLYLRAHRPLTPVRGRLKTRKSQEGVRLQALCSRTGRNGTGREVGEG